VILLFKDSWLLTFMAHLRLVLTEDMVMRLDMVMSHDFCVVGRKKLWLCIPHIVKTIENY